jgi:hypothetical protein
VPQAFTQEAVSHGLRVIPISLGNTLSDAEVDSAGLQLLQAERKVVVVTALENDIPRVLRRMKATIEDAGDDYKSFTWIIPTLSTEVTDKTINRPSELYTLHIVCAVIIIQYRSLISKADDQLVGRIPSERPSSQSLPFVDGYGHVY